MREIFKQPKPGQALTSSYMNRLDRVVNPGGTTSNANRSTSAMGDTQSFEPAFTEDILEIVTVNDPSQDLHQVHRVLWNTVTSAWETITTQQYTLDAGSMGLEGFQPQDKVTGWWHSGRQAYIPSSSICECDETPGAPVFRFLGATLGECRGPDPFTPNSDWFFRYSGSISPEGDDYENLVYGAKEVTGGFNDTFQGVSFCLVPDKNYTNFEVLQFLFNGVANGNQLSAGHPPNNDDEALQNYYFKAVKGLRPRSAVQSFVADEDPDNLWFSDEIDWQQDNVNWYANTNSGAEPGLSSKILTPNLADLANLVIAQENFNIATDAIIISMFVRDPKETALEVGGVLFQGRGVSSESYNGNGVLVDVAGTV